MTVAPRQHVAAAAALVVSLAGGAWAGHELPAAGNTGSAAVTAATPPAHAPKVTAGGTVVALGDSVGVGSACGCTPFPARLPGALKVAVDTVRLNRSGQTTDGLLAQLRERATRREVAAAQRVVVIIGANDFDDDDVEDEACTPGSRDCYTDQIAATRRTTDRILQRIRALRPSAAADSTVVVGYWNVFADGGVGRRNGPDYLSHSRDLTMRVNRSLRQSASNAGARFVDPMAAFFRAGIDKQLAPDGEHLSSTGHALMARLIAAEIAR